MTLYLKLTYILSVLFFFMSCFATPAIVFNYMSQQTFKARGALGRASARRPQPAAALRAGPLPRSLLQLTLSARVRQVYGGSEEMFAQVSVGTQMVSIEENGVIVTDITYFGYHKDAIMMAVRSAPPRCPSEPSAAGFPSSRKTRLCSRCLGASPACASR